MKNILLVLLSLFLSFSYAQVQIGGDIDGAAAGDNFGRSVSLSSDGNRMAVGASKDGSSTSSGYVKVYELIGSDWQQIGDDIDGDAASDRFGWSISLSSDGSRLAIGATGGDGNGINSGLVRIYDLIGGDWQQIGGDIIGESAGDWSGQSVSLSQNGNIVAIGAIFNDGNGSGAGHVRVFELNGGVWQQLGGDLDGASAGDKSGISVSLSANGNILAIGALGGVNVIGNDNEEGYVRVYELIGGVWQQLGGDLAGTSDGDQFGRPVALSSNGKILAIGAQGNDEGEISGGQVKIFKLTGGIWQQLGNDINGEAVYADFGWAVSLSSNGNIVAIGAPSSVLASSDNDGKVRIYGFSAGTWNRLGSIIDGEAEFDRSGYSVSLSSDGSKVAIGAIANDDNGEFAGHVRVYELLEVIPNPCSSSQIICPDNIVTSLNDSGFCDSIFVNVPLPIPIIDPDCVGGIPQIVNLSSGQVPLNIGPQTSRFNLGVTNFTIGDAPPTTIQDVIITGVWNSDNGSSVETPTFTLEGNSLGVLPSGGGDCSENAFTFIIPIAVYNMVAADGILDFTIGANSAVDDFCSEDYIDLNLRVVTELLPYVNDFNGEADASGIYPVGVTTVTYCTLDAFAEEICCSFTVTILDPVAPIINCPPDQLEDCGAGCPPQTPPISLVEAAITETEFLELGGTITENCSMASVTYIDQTAGICPVVVTRTYTVTDTGGNTATCEQTINVFDNTPPVLICPPTLFEFTSITNQPPYDDLTAFQLAEGIASDTIAFSLVSEVSDGATCPETITRVYSVSDECGNVSTCEQLLVFRDNATPVVFSCPDDIVMPLIPGTCDGSFIDIPLPNVDAGCVSGIPQFVPLSSGQVPLNIAPQTGLPFLGETNFSISDAPPTTLGEVIITGVWNSDNSDSNERPSFSLEGFSLGLLPSGGGDCTENAFTFIIPFWLYNQVAADGILDFTVGADGSVNNDCSVDYIDIKVAVQIGTELLPYVNDFNGAENASGVYPIGVTTVTYCTRDVFGNEFCCSFTVTVLDPIAPLITCPADQTEDCGTACTPLAPPLSLIETVFTETEFLMLGGAITENCTIASITYIDIEVGICPTVVTRTFTATDLGGNTSTCVQTINVFDNTPPQMFCPPTIYESFSLANQPPYPNLTAFLAAGGVVSDTIDFSLDSEVTDGAFCPETITRVYSVSDECGNVSTCQQQLIFTDPTPPVITCPNDIVMPAVPGTCNGGFINIPLPSVSNVCVRGTVDTVNLSSGQVPLNIAPQTGLSTLGETNFSIGSAPTSTIADVTITGVWNSDNNLTSERPTFTLEGNSIGFLPSGGADCSENAFSFTIPIGVYNVVAADGVLDFIVGADISIGDFCAIDYIDINLEVVIVSQLVPYVNDFNGEADASDVYPIGVTTVNYCTLDAFGNEICCSFNVTILDPDPLILSCPNDVIMTLDPGVCDSGFVNVPLPTFNNTCIKEIPPIVNLTSGQVPLNIAPQTNLSSLGVTNFSIGGAPTNTIEEVVITGVWNSDNGSTSEQPTFTLEGNSLGLLPSGGGDCSENAFTFTIPIAVYNLIAADGILDFTVGADGNVDSFCSTDYIDINLEVVTGSVSLLYINDFNDKENASGVYPIGVTTVTYCALDAFGDEVCCSFTVTVLDSVAPLITCPMDQVENCGAGCPSLTPPLSLIDTIITETEFFALGGTITEDCNIASVSYIDSEAGICPTVVTRTFTATDESGNASTCAQTITVFDNTPPELSCPPTINENFAIANQPAYPNLAAFLAAGGTASDTIAFSLVSEVSDGARCPETITRVYSVSDECGNVSTCEQLLVFTEPIPLEFTCPDDIVMSLIPGTCDGGFINVPLPTLNNACVSGIPQTVNLASGQVPLNIAPQTGLSSLGETDFSIGGAPTTTIQDVIITGVWNSDNGSTTERPTFSLEGISLGLLPSGGGDCTENAFTFTIPMAIYNVVAADGVLDFIVGGDSSVGSFCSIDYIDINLEVKIDSAILPYINDFNGTENASGIYPIGVTTVTFCTFDGLGDEVCCSFTVTVLDAVVPLISCPTDQIEDCGTDCPPLVPPLSLVDAPLTEDQFLALGGTITENCTIASLTYFDTEAGLCPVVVTRIFTVTDTGGNTNTCEQTINIFDNTPPEIICPPTIIGNFSLADQPPYPNLSAFLSAGGVATDAVSFSLDSEVTDGASCPETITRVYSVSDECGNVSTCEQLLVLVDPTPLVITCPNDIVMPTPPGACDGGFINIPLPTLNDACVREVPQIINLSSGQVPLNISPQTGLSTLGVTNFSISSAPTTTIDDVIITGVWNSDNGSFSERPTFMLEGTLLGNLPSGGVDCDENAFTFTIPIGQYNIAAADGILDFTIGANSSVNSFCNIDYIDVNVAVQTGTDLLPYINDFNGQADASGIYPIGVRTVTYCALDGLGNEVCCSFTVTVLDPDPIALTCPDDIVVPLAPGVCDGSFVNIPLPMINNTCVTGVPAVVNLSSGQVPLNISPQTGLSSLGVTNFTIGGAPTTTSADVIITGVWNSDNGDSSERPNFTLEGTSLGFLPSGGGDCTENSFSFIIPIALYNIAAADGVLDFTVGADSSVDSFCTEDYIDVNVAVQTGADLIPYINDFNGQVDASGIYPIGVTTVTYCALDAFENEVCCSFTVTVLDPEPLALTCPNDIVMPLAPGACDGGFINIPLPTINNSCVLDIPAILNISSGQVPLNVAPQTGLLTLAETNFSIDNAPTATFADVQLTGVWNSDNDLSNERPTLILEGNFIGLLPSGGLECEENAFTFTISTAVYNAAAADGKLDFVVGSDFSVGSNCTIDYIDINLGVLTGPELLPFVNDFNGREDASGVYPIGVTTVTYCALDLFENETCCSFTVTVLDPDPLALTCPNDIVMSLAPGACDGGFINIPLPTINNTCVTDIPAILNLSSGQVPLNIAPQTGFPTLGETNFSIDNAPTATFADVQLTGVWNSDNDLSNERPIFRLEGNFLGFLPSGGLECEENAFTFTIPIAQYNVAAADGKLDFIVGADFSIGSNCSIDYIDINLEVLTGSELIPYVNDFNGREDASGVYPIGVTTVTYCALDAFENETCCSFNVTVLDTEAPLISCPADQLEGCGTNCPPIEPPLSLVDAPLTEAEFTAFGGTITEACEIASLTYIDTESGICPIVITRTFTATDDSGNSSTCEQTINIFDNTPPEIICPPAIIGNFLITDQPPYLNLAAFEAAGGIVSDATALSLESEGTDGGICPEIITRVYSVSDECGNASTCKQFLILNNPTPPEIICPPNIIVECGNPTDPMATGMATATTSCGGIMITSLDSFIIDCGVTGIIERTWTASDSIGNISVCTQRITIEDTTPPVFELCPDDITLECDQPTDTMTLGSPTATDACPNMMMAMLPSTFDSDNGFAGNMFDLTNGSALPVVISSFDANIDGIAGQSATFEVYYRLGTYVGFETNPTGWISMGTASTTTAGGDMPTPVPIGGLTLLSGQVYGIYFVLIQGPGDLRYTNGNNTYNDGALELSAGIGKGDPDFIGETFLARTWNGNIHYTIIAPESPSQTYEEISTQGMGCNEFTYSINRIWTAVDNCGNVSSCTQTVTVEDNNFPTINCPADITIECDQATDPTVTGTATATGENCSIDNALAITFSDLSTQVSSDCGNDSYTITRTWTATYTCGNATSCVQTINVGDTTPPIITCPADITLECGEDTSTSMTGMATGIDNCSAPNEVIISFEDESTQGPAGCAQSMFTITRTWSATDACGNATTCVQTIMVEDTTPPTIICASNLTIECDEDTSPANTGMAIGIDNCSAQDEVIISFDDESTQAAIGCEQYLYLITRTWTATDACGNTTTCLQTINIEDTTAPTITCPADVSLSCTESTLPINTGAATSIDNCSEENEITITFSDVSSQEERGCGQFTFDIARTWTATDICGNTTTCVQSITSTDTESPIISCLPNETLACNTMPPGAARSASEFIDFGGAISDDCTSSLNDFTVTYIDFPLNPANLNTCPGSAVEDRTLRRIYTITDLCGNASTCEQSFIYLESMEGPMITSVPSNQTVDCAINAFPQLAQFAAVGDCSTITYSVSDPMVNNGPAGCSGTSIEYIYTARDDCGRLVTHVQTYTLSNSSPEFICPVDICVIECPADTEMIQSQFDNYASFATVVSGCLETSITIDNDFDPDGFISQDCINPTVAVEGAVAYQIVAFTATDACGWNATCTALVVIKDDDGPVMNGTVSFGLDNCNDPDLEGNYTDWARSQMQNLSATDACFDEPVYFTYTPLSPNTDCSSGLASTAVSFIATDGCGNTTIVNTFYRIIGGGDSGTFMAPISNKSEFALFQNEPNPFAQETMIGFQLPEATEASLTIFDIAGRVVWTETQSYEAGLHQVIMNKADIGSTGVFYYQVSTPEYSATKKMIILK